MLGGVIKFQFYSRFVKISRVGQKISKNDIFGQNFFRGGGVKAKELLGLALCGHVNIITLVLKRT
jgi:hypothetical protein